MSFNQPRYQKSEAAEDRRAGRSASFSQQRASSGGYSKGDGAPAPSPSLSSNRSFKKTNNVLGGQSRVNVRPANISSEPTGAPPTQHNLQNGVHVQPQSQSQGQSDAGHTSATARPAETPPASNRSIRAVPKAPTSQPPGVSSEMLPPSTPQKAPGDASKPFSFQFGSLSPGLMNGMQIPARTSSARPNLDEQKRDQARHDAIKSGPPVPVPPAPKHPLQKRDSGATDQSNAGDSLTVPKGKKDQVPPIPPSVQSQKPPAQVMPAISMQMPFNQPQVPIPFNGPNTSIQSQGMASASLQLPMPMSMLPVGNPPPSMQQQMFVAGLQPHMIQPQGIMHQGQGLSFGAQINAQFSPQLGTLGMGISPYSQQGGAKFGGPCKTSFKITHPETHQEVRLDKRTEGFSDGGPSSRSHPNVPPQAHHISSYPSNHPVSYYTNSYSLSPTYFPAQSSLPLPGTQITPTSQAPRFNPPVNQGAQRMTLMNSQDTPAPEISRSSSNIAKGRKKRKEILPKRKKRLGPEEKKEAVKSSRGTEIASENTHANQATAETSPNEAVVSDDVEQVKAEIDDWEDAADVSSPALEPSTSGQQVDVFVPSGENINGFVARKYSRDFLLKFAERCTNLPGTFEVTRDIAEVFNPSANVSRFVDRDSHPSPGRTIDRQSGGARQDHRGSGLVDDDKWSKLGPFGPGRDLRLDVGLGPNLGLRPGQGGNYDVLRNPRAQTPVQYAGGIPSGPMQSLGFQGGIQRNNSDADRWQRATGFQQKGLIPSPQTPLQMMHRAEKKYEVGKVADEEQAKQRQLKAILNKLTPQNFERLFEQVKAVNIDNATTLRGLISQIFDKALMEPTFCEMYANLCCHLAQELPHFSEDDDKITFKRVLLNKCQEEFERGERQ